MSTDVRERPTRDDIAAALKGACEELGWTPGRLAVEAGATENAARAWLAAAAAPASETLLFLMRRHMVVRERLLGVA